MTIPIIGMTPQMTKASNTPDRAALPSVFDPIDWDAVERDFRSWLNRNDHALTLGGVGDLVDLVFVLKAAIAKS